MNTKPETLKTDPQPTARHLAAAQELISHDNYFDGLASSREMGIKIIAAIIAKHERGGDERLREALILILPMAKGYAYEHPVGSNQRFVEQAEHTLHSEFDAKENQ